MRGSRSITVVRKPRVDKLTPPTGAPAAEHDVENCAVLPRQTYEQGRGWVTVTGKDVYCFEREVPDVLASDLVRIDGITYKVDGKPAPYENARARVKATLIKLEELSSG